MTQPTTYSEEEAKTIDLLLWQGGIGARLLADWVSIANLAQNLKAAKLTEKQRERLAAAFTLNLVREKPASAVRSPADAFSNVRDLQTEMQEHFVVLSLDTRNNIIHRENLYKGSLNTSMIRVGEVFRSAIVHSAAAIIICHNHPSGDPAPSPEDVAVTRAIAEAGKLLDIELLDHIVVGSGRFVSLKERGLGL